MAAAPVVAPPSESWVRALPKVELHCHLEGAMRPTTVIDLARRHRVALPAADPTQLYRFRDLEHFIEVYGLVCAVLQDVDDFHRLAYEVLEDRVDQGVVHAELFFTPWFHLTRGVPFGSLWDGLATGVRDACTDFGCSARLVLDVDKPAGAAHAMEMVQLAAGCDRDVLVGIGGDDLEDGIDHRIFAPAMAEARRLGFRTTIHCGEFSVDSVRAAVHELGCERLDHGVLLGDDSDLLAEVVARGIPLTCCPTSDIEISKVWPTLAEHPYRRLREAGVVATLNSDDPAMLGHDLAAEYCRVADVFGFGASDLVAIARDGIEACWLDGADKRTLVDRLDVWCAASGNPPTPT